MVYVYQWFAFDDFNSMIVIDIPNETYDTISEIVTSNCGFTFPTLVSIINFKCSSSIVDLFEKFITVWSMTPYLTSSIILVL